MSNEWVVKCICNDCAFKFQREMSVEKEDDVRDNEIEIICLIAPGAYKADEIVYPVKCEQHKTKEEIIAMQQAQAMAQAEMLREQEKNSHITAGGIYKIK